MATRLYKLRIREISGVDRPANKRKFLLVKCEDEAARSVAHNDKVDKVNLTVPLATDEQIEKFAKEHYGSVEKAFRENWITVGPRNIP